MKAKLKDTKQYSVVELVSGRIGFISGKSASKGFREVCFGERNFGKYPEDTEVEILKMPYELATDFVFERMYEEQPSGQMAMALKEIINDAKDKDKLTKTHADKFVLIAKKGLQGKLRVDEYNQVQNPRVPA